MRGMLPRGEQIRTLRVTKGMTQRELSDLANLDTKTIRKAEQGNRLDIESLVRIAEVLNVEPVQLYQTAADANAHYDLVVRWQSLFTARNSNDLAELFHPEGTLVIAGGEGIPYFGSFHGREEIRNAHENIWNGVKQESPKLEDLTFLISEEGITLRGDVGVHLPTGEIAFFTCIQIFSFRDGLIYRLESQFDTLEFAKRMNLL
jgi:transcriptional regulator with XRE-family HTH domain